MQSHEDLVKSVSKNLKYYFDVKRREDGFDLSGPCIPRLDHPPLKSRPTLMYDGLHDKPVKHYFTQHDARQRITHMRPARPLSADKVRKIKRQLRRYMNKYHFVSKVQLSIDQLNKKMPWVGASATDPKGITNSSKYVTDPFQMLRENAHETPKFTKPFRGGRPLLRAAPPETITRGEAVRLVNSASRSLLAVMNGQNRHEGEARSELGSVEPVYHSQERDLDAMVSIQLLRHNRNRPATAVSYRTRLQGFKRGDGIEREPHGKASGDTDRQKVQATSAKHSIAGSSKMIERPQSARGKLQNHSVTSSDDETDKEVDRVPAWLQAGEEAALSSPELSARTPVPPAVPRSATSSARTRSSRQAASSADSSSSSPDVSEAATTGRYQDGRATRFKQQRPKSAKRGDRIERAEDRHSELSHSRVTLSEDGSYEEVPLDDTDPEDEFTASVPKKTSDDKGIQTGWELFATFDPTQVVVDEGEMATYKVTVRTGKGIGASGNVPVHIVLFGERGCSKDIQLDRSLTYKIPFQRGQEDLFSLETVYVGELKSIRIGHNKTDLGQSWFLDSVAIEDTKKGWIYEFPCNNWLSAKSEDRMTRRNLTYSSTRLVEQEQPLPNHQQETNSSESSAAESPKEEKLLSAAEAPDSPGRRSLSSMGYSNMSIKGSYSAGDGGSRLSKQRSYSLSHDSNESDGDGAAAVYSGSRDDGLPEQRDNQANSSKQRRGASKATKQISEVDNVFDVLLKGSSVAKDRKDADSSSESGTSSFFDGTSNIARASVKKHTTDGASDAASEGRSTVVFESLSQAGEPYGEDGYILGSKVNPDGEHPAEDAGRSKASDVLPTSHDALSTVPGPTIHGAARSGNLSRVKELVHRFSSLRNGTDDFGNTALHLACQYGHADIAKWLLQDAGADSRLRNNAGYEAAHVAALHGHLGCLQSVINDGALNDIDARSDDNKTLLHLAAMAGYLNTCRFLIANGASLSACDDFGRTAQQIADDCNHHEISEYLEACQQDLTALTSHDSSSQSAAAAAAGFIHMGTHLSEAAEEKTTGVTTYTNDAAWVDDTKEKFPDAEDETSVESSAVDLRHKVEQQQQIEDKRKLYKEMEERKENKHMSFLDMVREDAGISSSDDDGSIG